MLARIDAHSTELVEKCGTPAIVFMPEVSKTHLGGTMRLGLRPSIFTEQSAGWSKIRTLYGSRDVCWERHRHRYEVNPELVATFEKGAPGLTNGNLAKTGGEASEPGKDETYPGAISNGLPARAFRRVSSTASTLGDGSSSMSTAGTATSGGESTYHASTSLRFVGKSTSGQRMQILELQDHPYFVGMQAHPEFASRPLNPSPPFLGLVAAASGLDVLQEHLARGREYVPPHPDSAMSLQNAQGEVDAEKDAAMAGITSDA